MRRNQMNIAQSKSPRAKSGGKQALRMVGVILCVLFVFVGVGTYQTDHDTTNLLPVMLFAVWGVYLLISYIIHLKKPEQPKAKLTFGQFMRGFGIFFCGSEIIVGLSLMIKEIRDAADISIIIASLFTTALFALFLVLLIRSYRKHSRLPKVDTAPSAPAPMDVSYQQPAQTNISYQQPARNVNKTNLNDAETMSRARANQIADESLQLISNTSSFDTMFSRIELCRQLPYINTKQFFSKLETILPTAIQNTADKTIAAVSKYKTPAAQRRHAAEAIKVLLTAPMIEGSDRIQNLIDAQIERLMKTFPDVPPAPTAEFGPCDNAECAKLAKFMDNRRSNLPLTENQLKTVGYGYQGQLKNLMDEGFLTKSPGTENLESYLVTDLKSFLTAKGITPIGKKVDIIAQIRESCSEEEINSYFTQIFRYRITEKGQRLIDKYMLEFIHISGEYAPLFVNAVKYICNQNPQPMHYTEVESQIFYQYGIKTSIDEIYNYTGFVKDYIYHRDTDCECPACIALDGKRLRYKEAVIGKNYPPMDADCTCIADIAPQKDWKDEEVDQLFEEWDAYYAGKQK